MDRKMTRKENSKRNLLGKRSLMIAALLATGLMPTAYWLLPTVAASDPGSGDWPMWGETSDRNMVSKMKGPPTTWDPKTKKNVKWVAQLGSQSYGNVVVSVVMDSAGTNNEGLRLPDAH